MLLLLCEKIHKFIYYRRGESAMFTKRKTIVLELHEQYSNQEELSHVVVQDLKERGKLCQNVDDYTILVNNKTYSLSAKTMAIRGVILRQAILKESC